MFDKEFVISYFENLAKKLEEEEIRGRELKVPIIRDKAIAIVGPRRAGKTYYLLKFLRENKNSIYFDLEHSAFKDLTHKEVFEIISLFEERFKVKVKNVLLDEIQEVKGWERLVRSLLDSGYNVILSGSSSRLLSKEVATQMRGRSLTYLLLPLSFREYLSFHGFELKKVISLSEKVKIMGLMENYLEWGGYPEVVLQGDKKEKILREYFDTVLQRDFIERFNVVRVDIAKLIFEFVFQNFSKEISVNKIARYVSSRIGRNAKNTVYEYVEKLPESFSIFFVEKFEKSVYERKTHARKVYVCDVGLSNVVRFERDVGKRMENAVFLDLLRKTNDNPLMTIYYFKDHQQREVDFVVKEGLRVKQLIQVTYASSRDEVEKREIKALLKASELLNCKDLVVITWDYEDEEEVKGKRIRYVPLWKWLLGL